MPGDEPIIVSGGNSVTVEYSDNYKPEASVTKPESSITEPELAITQPESSITGKKMKNKGVNLAYLEIKSTGEKIDLKSDDVVTIHTR